MSKLVIAIDKAWALGLTAGMAARRIKRKTEGAKQPQKRATAAAVSTGASRDGASSGRISSAEPGRGRVIAVGAVIVGLTILSYANSLHGPFVFDDIPAVVDNPSIRNLSNLGAVLSPPLSVTGAVGRPAVNLSLAINYAISGTSVTGYHVTNLLIHLIAALLFFGAVRRTLLRGGVSWAPIEKALAASGVSAALWAVHPLLTESVTSVIQRSESLMGLFFLATFYCFIRSLDGDRSTIWRVAAAAACFAGAASKEVMVACPLLLLLYDRTFVSGSFKAAWRARKGVFIALFSSWGIVLALAAGTAGRNATVGFDVGIGAGEYLMTQCWGVANYLLLSVWPARLVFDYGSLTVTEPLRVVPGALVLTALLVLTIRMLLRNRPLGFLGAWFFLILAPSSSVLPLATQTVAEHRMYLPLAAIALIVAVTLVVRLNRKGIAIAAVLSAALIGRTVVRNRDYQSAVALWQDTVTRLPENGRAHNDLANALDAEGRIEEALTHYELAVSLSPGTAKTYYNMSVTLEKLGRFQEAEVALETAVRLNPEYVKALTNLGILLARRGETQKAVRRFEKAVALSPDDAETLMNAANGYLATGAWGKGADMLRRVLALDENNTDALGNLGVSLMRSGQVDEAVRHLEAAARRFPKVPSIHYNLGTAYKQIGLLDKAAAAYRRVITLDQSHERARKGLESLGI